MESHNSKGHTTSVLTFTNIPTTTCDESKCVSRALSNLHNGSFTCYGGDDTTLYPRMCADGFLPMVLEEEPSRVTTARDGVTKINLSYYTCCPPPEKHHADSSSDNNINLSQQHQEPILHLSTETTKTTPRRRCSDPITSNNLNTGTITTTNIAETAASVCDHEEFRKHPAPMKPNISPVTIGRWPLHKTESVVCCDYDNMELDSIKNIDTDFLGDTECVSYRSPFYEAFWAINEPGMLRPMTCDFPEGSFRFARPMRDAIGNKTTIGRYQCCKSGPGLPPFVQDSTFRNFVYMSLALYCLAAVITVVVVIALLVPFLIQLRRDNGKECSNNHHRGSLQRRQAMITREQAVRSSCANTATDVTWTKCWLSGRARPRYSTYNLYLAYLLIIDLVFLLYEIVIFSNYINQNFDLNQWDQWLRESDMIYGFLSWDKVFTGSYISANLWINCSITHEILVLLRASQKARRVDQPSLTKVNLQTATGIVIAAGAGLSTHYILDSIENSIDRENYEMVAVLESWFRVVMCVFIFLPITYVLAVAILIWWRGYIPEKTAGSARDRSVRELLIYVCRIVAVFAGIWIPAMGLNMYATATDKTQALVVVSILVAIQPLLTVGMILTKSDARGYVRDFFGILFGSCCCCCCRDHRTTTRESMMMANDGSRKSQGFRNSIATSRWSIGPLPGLCIADDDVDPETGGADSDGNDDREIQPCTAISNGDIDHDADIDADTRAGDGQQ